MQLGVEACDDANNVETDDCLTTCQIASCGDGHVWEGQEICDDGVNDGGYDGCAVDCAASGPFCGDGVANGPEVCDDGADNGMYDSCALGCAASGPFCGDGIQNGPEICDDGDADNSDGCLTNCSTATGCAAIKAADPGAASGMYVIDPDGDGGTPPFDIYCEMTIDGGGWQLISVRHFYEGALFADNICTGIGSNCSGTIRDVQLDPDVAPDLLFATLDGAYWLRMTGLAKPGSNALLDVITLDRLLAEGGGCTAPHYCGLNLDSNLSVAGSSPNFVPRFTVLNSQWVRHGGIWFGNGGGNEPNHVVDLNYSVYCGSGGLDLSDKSDQKLGNVKCGVPGALYFKY